MILDYHRSDMVLGLKGQKSKVKVRVRVKFRLGFLSRVSILLLTRDIDIVFL